jgi:hypothetical protein
MYLQYFRKRVRRGILEVKEFTFTLDKLQASRTRRSSKRFLLTSHLLSKQRCKLGNEQNSAIESEQ